MDVPSFIHSSVDGHLSFFFFFLAIRNHAAVNICVQVFVWTYVFNSLGSEIAAPYGDSVINFLKNCQTVFRSSCTILHSHWQHIRVPVLPYPCQHLFLSVLWLIAILVGVNGISCSSDLHCPND